MNEKKQTDIRLIAFYLPQFHPIPENDEWWGKGFTEWTNVTKAYPLFDGHYQPHLPTDLGFYDLRLRETRLEQIDLAKKYGIDGFCYHYYWFSGQRVLNQPLDDMFADQESDMPFCLCWANENWTRRWDGAQQEILLEQKYQPGDDLAFIQSIVPFFKDSRYIRINGAPVLIVYTPQQIPDARRTVDIWRRYCAEQGIADICLVAALTHGNQDYEEFGFDVGVEFPPHNVDVENVNLDISFNVPYYGYALLYHEFAQSFIDRDYDHDNNVFRTVCPSWDNTARTGSRAGMVLNATPNNYEYWLAETIKKTRDEFPTEERIVFINAWNEWAEGCHLEPDRKYGAGFLEATDRVRRGATKLTSFTHVDHMKKNDDQMSIARELLHVILKHISRYLGVIKYKIKKYPALKSLTHKVYELLGLSRK